MLKAFKVLEAVAAGAGPMSAADVAEAAGLERVTTYRMLRTIEEAGYLDHDAATKTFRINPRMLTLARPVFADGPDRQRIADLLRATSERTGETCHYSELSGIETVLTQRAKGVQLVAVDFAIGTRCELHATSVGKAILAHQPPAFIQDYLTLDLKTYTDRTIADPDLLISELERVRMQGHAFDFEELSSGMNCIAVPIRNAMGHVEGGISISGPSNRLTRARLNELGQIMRDEVRRIGA
ncbi:IclR family transcriptional regulator [Actibacterium mucosum]|uniref:IclR family transcriptional regulator n=1 Tax=Actibacterium mucosum TaxID=1087332 RepID=UPI0013781866|nr:IclR family transcriptional regulator [Actibacterium mucosum]